MSKRDPEPAIAFFEVGFCDLEHLLSSYMPQCSSSLLEHAYSGATRLEYDLRRHFAEDWRPSQITLTAGEYDNPQKTPQQQLTLSPPDLL
jgi:hypothetical protein